MTYNPNEIPEGLNVTSDCGYEVSLILCDTYSNRMSRHLTKYYSEIIHEATNDDNNSRLLTVVVKLHKLILRLWETVPELINAVIGFIYHELIFGKRAFQKRSYKINWSNTYLIFGFKFCFYTFRYVQGMDFQNC